MHFPTYSIKYKLIWRRMAIHSSIFLLYQTPHTHRFMATFHNPRVRYYWATKLYWHQDQEFSILQWLPKPLFAISSTQINVLWIFSVVSLFKMPHSHPVNSDLMGPFKWHMAFVEFYNCRACFKALLHPTHQPRDVTSSVESTSSIASPSSKLRPLQSAISSSTSAFTQILTGVQYCLWRLFRWEKTGQYKKTSLENMQTHT